MISKNTSLHVKSILGGSIGNLVEWYDWYVYSSFSLYFAPIFFPKGNLTSQLLNTSAIFAVGFLMRPIGGWLLGAYADNRGRKAALLLSVFMMCFGSLMIALTPGYETIGIFSPLLLVIARLLQGLSIGGEYGTSATYLSEMAPAYQRGFYSSLQCVTLVMGQLLALSVLILLQHLFLDTHQIEVWGWRIPFFIGALFALVAFYMRRGIHETDAFLNEKKDGLKINIIRELLKYPRQITIVVGLTMGSILAFYTYTTYMQKFMVNTIGLSKMDATLISALTLFLFMVVQPIMGLISDKIGRRPLIITFGLLGTIFTVPILTALNETTNVWMIFLLIMAGLLIVSCFTSIGAVVKAELFPTEIRALGVGLPFAITVSIFGGSTEYVALWLKSVGHETWFYWYVTGCIAVSLMISLLMHETKGRINESDEKISISVGY